jgi:hypothetical protein
LKWKLLSHDWGAPWLVNRKVEEELSSGSGGGDADSGTVVDDPVGTGREQDVVFDGGADREHARTSRFAGFNAEGRILDDDAIVRVEMEGGGTLKIRLRIGFAALDVRGGDKVLNVRPKLGGAQTDFGESAGGGSDDGKLRGRNGGQQLLRAGKSDDVGDFLDFAALHPTILLEVDFCIGLRKQFANGSEASAAVSRTHHVVGIEMVLQGPAGPNACDGWGGIDEDPVHIEEESFAGDLCHGSILSEENRSDRAK